MSRWAPTGFWPRAFVGRILLVPLLAVVLGGQADVTGLLSGSGSGHLSAVAAGEVAAPPSQVVVENGASDADGLGGPLVDAVREAIRRTLTARGIEVAETGSPILRFIVRSAPEASLREGGDEATTPRTPSIGTNRPTEIHDRVHDQVTVPLVQEGGPPTSHYAISLLLFVPGEEPRWNATIEASGNVKDPTDLLRRMTRAAMDAFGVSAERDFVLSCEGTTDTESGLCLR